MPLPLTLSLPKGECGRARKGGTAEGGNYFNLFNDFNHFNYRKLLVFLTAIAEGDGCLLQKLSDKLLDPIWNFAQIKWLRVAEQ